MRGKRDQGRGRNQELREARLAYLLGECIDRLNAAGQDLEEILSRDPELRDELLAELAVFEKTGFRREAEGPQG